MRNKDGENAFVSAATGGHSRTMEVFLEDRRYGGVDIADQETALDRASYLRNAPMSSNCLSNAVSTLIPADLMGKHL